MTNEQIEELVIGNSDEQLSYGKDNNLGAAYFMMKDYLDKQTVFDAKGWFDCFWGRIAEIANNRKLDSVTSNWISVDDRLPDKEGFYLTYFFDGHLNETQIAIKFWEKEVNEFLPWDAIDELTHWQPLPEPPSEVPNDL